MRHLIAIALLALLSVPASAADGDPRVLFETSKGNILIELHPDKAPKTVENFLAYVESGYYEGTIFHRVIPGFMAQGGGFTADMQKKKTQPPIANEADNGLRNLRGTLSMARTNDPNSATAQFFLNVVDNAFLDHTAKTMRGWGYAVFATVIEGMEVADAIVAVPTTNHGQMKNVPVSAITIDRASVVKVDAEKE